MSFLSPVRIGDVMCVHTSLLSIKSLTLGKLSLITFHPDSNFKLETVLLGMSREIPGPSDISYTTSISKEQQSLAASLFWHL